MANGHGGARPNSGPNPSWLKEECGRIIDKYKLVERLGLIASGAEIMQPVFSSGEVIPIPAKLSDQLEAKKMLLDRWAGKPTQGLEVTGADGREFNAGTTRDLSAAIEVLAGAIADKTKERTGNPT